MPPGHDEEHEARGDRLALGTAALWVIVGVLWLAGYVNGWVATVAVLASGANAEWRLSRGRY